jgi:hypothetical protein
MPDVTVAVAVGGDDGRAWGIDASYPPAFDVGESAAVDVDVIRRKVSGGDYWVYNGFLRFNTGASLPDDATVTAAVLRFYAYNKSDEGNRSLVGEYHAWDGGDPTSGEFSTTAPGSPILSVDVTALSNNALNDVSLTDLSGISKTGYTAIRLMMDGGQPADNEQARITIAALEHATQPAAELIITYTEANTDAGTVYLKLTPSFVSEAALGEALPTRLGFSSGTEYYVNHVTGNNANDGLTQGTAWATTIHALTEVGTDAGAIINIVGTFNPDAPRVLKGVNGVSTLVLNSFGSGNPANPVTLRALPCLPADGGWALGDGHYTCVQIQNADNSYTTGLLGINVQAGNDSLRIEGIDFCAPAAQAASTGEMRVAGCVTVFRNNHNIEFLNCKAHDTWGHGFAIFTQDSSGTGDERYCSNIQWWNPELTRIAERNTGLAGESNTADPSTPANGYNRRGTHPFYFGGTGDLYALPDDPRSRDIVVANALIHKNRWGKGIEWGNAILRGYEVNCDIVEHGQGVEGAGVNEYSAAELGANAGLGAVLYEWANNHKVQDVKIANCIFKDSFSNAVGYGPRNDPVGNEVVNCIAHGNLADATYGQFNPRENHTGAAGTPQNFSESGSIYSDPLFADQVNADYRIQIGSPAIRAGNVAYATPTDFRGIARNPVQPSIGAFEYVEDEDEEPPIEEPPPITVPAPRPSNVRKEWRMIHLDHNFVELGELFPNNLNFSLPLSAVGDCSYEIVVGEPLATWEKTFPYRTDYLLAWGDKILQGGIHTGISIVDVEQATVQVSGNDYLHYLEGRWYPFDPLNLTGAGYIAPIGTDLFTIIEALLDAALALPESLEMFYNNGLSGQTINDFKIEAGDTEDLKSKIETLSKKAPGFDYWVDPFRELHLYPDGRGSIKEFTFEQGKNIYLLDYANRGPSGTHTLGIVQGEGNKIARTKDHPSIVTYRRWDVHEDLALKTTDATAVQQATDAEAERNIAPRIEFSARFVGEEDIDILDILDTGDRPMVHADLGWIVVNDYMRIVNIQGQTDDEGNFELIFTFDDGTLAQ